MCFTNVCHMSSDLSNKIQCVKVCDALSSNMKCTLNPFLNHSSLSLCPAFQVLNWIIITEWSGQQHEPSGHSTAWPAEYLGVFWCAGRCSPQWRARIYRLLTLIWKKDPQFARKWIATGGNSLLTVFLQDPPFQLPVFPWSSQAVL